MARLLHVDDPRRLALYRRAAVGELTAAESDPVTSSGRTLLRLHFSTWGVSRSIQSLPESIEKLRSHPALATEIAELMALLDERANHVAEPLDDFMGWRHEVPLAVHSRVSRDEILSAFGLLHLGSHTSLHEALPLTS